MPARFLAVYVGISLFVGVVAVPIAHAISVSELIELFIVLEIIPKDKADDARAVFKQQQIEAGEGAQVPPAPQEPVSTPAPVASPESSAPLAPSALTVPLSPGDSGDDVENLQTLLKQFPDVYPEGIVTGFFGPLTQRAVERFQAKHGIVATGSPATTGYGILGPQTRAKLNELITGGAGASGVVPPGLFRAPGLYQAQATTTPAFSATTTPAVPAVPAAPATPAAQAASTTVATTTPAFSGAIPASPATSAVPAMPTQTTQGSGGGASGGATTTGTTTASTDTTGPAISNIQVVDISQWSARVTWTTSEPAYGKVSYKVSNSTAPVNEISSVDLKTSHSITLGENMTAGESYVFTVHSTDGAGNAAMSGERSFTLTQPITATTTTQSADTTPPVISNIQVVTITENSVTVTWATNEDTTVDSVRTYINPYYSAGSGSVVGVTNPAVSKSHSYTWNNLSAGATYTFAVASKDVAGNITISNEQTFTSAAPVVAACTDSDGGKDIYTKGTTVGPLSTAPDTTTTGIDNCEGTAGNKQAHEYYCSTDGFFKVENIPCPSGECAYGVCLTATSSAAVPTGTYGSVRSAFASALESMTSVLGRILHPFR